MSDNLIILSPCILSLIHHRSGKSNHNYVVENKDKITLSSERLIEYLLPNNHSINIKVKLSSFFVPPKS